MRYTHGDLRVRYAIHARLRITHKINTQEKNRTREVWQQKFHNHLVARTRLYSHVRYRSQQTVVCDTNLSREPHSRLTLPCGITTRIYALGALLRALCCAIRGTNRRLVPQVGMRHGTLQEYPALTERRTLVARASTCSCAYGVVHRKLPCAQNRALRRTNADMRHENETSDMPRIEPRSALQSLMSPLTEPAVAPGTSTKRVYVCNYARSSPRTGVSLLASQRP